MRFFEETRKYGKFIIFQKLVLNMECQNWYCCINSKLLRFATLFIHQLKFKIGDFIINFAAKRQKLNFKN